MSLSLEIITMELVIFGRDSLSFFSVWFVSALRFLHWKLVVWVFLFFPLSTSLTSSLFSSQVTFFSWRQLQCSESTMSMPYPRSGPASCLWCGLQVPTYLDDLPQGQVWTTSHICFVLWVPLFLGVLLLSSSSLAGFLLSQPSLYFWAFVCPWAPYLGSEVTPSLSIPPPLHFICMHPTLDQVQLPLHLYSFSLHFDLPTLRDISQNQLKFTGGIVRLNTFQPILKLNSNLWTLLWRIELIHLLWPYCIL